jgi:protein SCO1/2
MPRHLLFAVVLSIALAAGAFMALRYSEPAEPQFALVLPAGQAVPEFSLLDQDGNPVDAAVFRDRWDLVFFGFTHCPDVCPTTLQVLSQAQQTLRESAATTLPRIVLVSVDPERDTPALMAGYMAHFGEGSLGLTGDLEEIRKLTGGLGIFFEKQPAVDGNYGVDHSAAVLLIDPNGELKAVFGAPHVPDNFVHDLPLITGGR